MDIGAVKRIECAPGSTGAGVAPCTNHETPSLPARAAQASGYPRGVSLCTLRMHRDQLMLEHAIPRMVLSSSRGTLVAPRHKLFWLLRQLPWQPTYPAIAQVMGVRHSTVINGVRKYQREHPSGPVPMTLASLREQQARSRRPMFDDGEE